MLSAINIGTGSKVKGQKSPYSFGPITSKDTIARISISGFLGDHLSINANLTFTAPEIEKGHCLQERLRALKTTNETGIPIFVPVCRSDGSYVEVQCFYGTGYCWCVNQEGKPEPGTSIQYERPKCRQKGSKRKRSRRRNKNRKSHRSHRKQACVQSDRSQFNRDVTNLIGSEYRSRHGKVPNGALNRQKEIVEWKFDQMDLDRYENTELSFSKVKHFF